MKIAIIVISSLLLLALLIITALHILGRTVADMVILPKRVSAEEIRQRDSDRGHPECFGDYDNVWERHDFTLEADKAVISGEYIVNPANSEGRKKVIIICHGHTVSRLASLKYGRMFYALGYNLVIFDERYFGRSASKYCTLGMNESQDVKKVIAYTRSIFGEDCFLGIHGESMGAASELLALDTEKPDFVVADCPFANTGRLMLYLTRQKTGVLAPYVLYFTRKRCMRCCDYDMKKVNPINSVRHSDVPICFIHGEDDDYIPCEHSKLMYRVCRNSGSELHIVPEAAHARSIVVDRDGYQQIIADFTKKIEAKAL